MSIEAALRGAIGAHKGWARRRDIEEELKRELEAGEIGHQRDLALIGERARTEEEWRGGLLERQEELLREREEELRGRVGVKYMTDQELLGIRQALMKFEDLGPFEIAYLEAVEAEVIRRAGIDPLKIKELPPPVGLGTGILDWITPWAREGELEPGEAVDERTWLGKAIGAGQPPPLTPEQIARAARPLREKYAEFQEELTPFQGAMMTPPGVMMSPILPPEGGWMAAIRRGLGFPEPEVDAIPPAEPVKSPKKRPKRKKLFPEGEIDPAQLEKWWREKR